MARAAWRGIVAGAAFALAMIGGHLWAVTHVARPPVVWAPSVPELAPLTRAPVGLLIPVEGIGRNSLRNGFDERRGARPHQALDIAAPHGTPVRAAVSGTLVRLASSRRGGRAVEQHDDAGAYCYYYAHLAGYASGLNEGQRVERGQLIGYVGNTGNASASAPHLHFGVLALGPDRSCWTGKPVNPYPLFP